MKLHELQYTEGARKARKRVGRVQVQEMVKQQVEVKKVKELDLVEVKNQDSKVDKLHYS